MAAAVSGVLPVCLDQQRSCVEDAEQKKKRLALMEKLRSKRSTQHRSWTESLKTIRTAVVDRRLLADSLERTQVQKCLDTLQRAMKVISQRSLVERLESVARQQTLTFLKSSTDPPTVTLQGDMFHVEVVMNKGGGVKEVKVAHQGDASICPELADILSQGDFAEFTSHLDGLQSIYKVTGERKLKSKAYLALQSLERDLNQLAQFQNSISGVANYIHKSPLGILLPRTAGKPMKLIYFVSPYDLLDKKTMSAHPMTVEAITEHGLGRSVTVCLEPGPSNKLQTMPLLTVKTSDGKSLPSFTGLTHLNSATLPACFVLVLPQPIPVASSVVQKIQILTKLDVCKDMGSHSLLSLILDSNSDGKMRKEQRLFVSLPDQHHVYFIRGVSGGVLEEPAVMLSRIPFTHPTHVPQILILLRQQLLFNSILASCIRPSAKKDLSCCMVFELTVISLQQLMVVFEHPAYDTMVTLDVDLSDITSLKCRVLCTNPDQSLCSEDYACCRVLQRCLSLPVLLRAMIRKGRSQLEKLIEAAAALAQEQARQAQEAAMWAAQVRQPRILPTTIPTKGRPPPLPPAPHTPTYPPTPSPVSSNPPSVGGMGDIRAVGGSLDLPGGSSPGVGLGFMGAGGDGLEKLGSSVLTNLLDSERSHSSPAPTAAATAAPLVSESPMLSRLLEDNISVATNVNPIPTPALQKVANKRVRKRRSQSELPTGRSPKHRHGDGESLDRFGSIDLESSSSPFEASLGGPGGMMMFPHQMGPVPPRPPSQGQSSSIIDLTEENMPESSLKKLEDTVDNFSYKDGKSVYGSQDAELSALLLNETEAICSPTAMKNSPATGPKNENASTSLEGVLTGSGEVGKASPSDPVASSATSFPGMKARACSQSSSSTLATFLGHGQVAPSAVDRSLHPGGPLQQMQQHQQDAFHHHQLSNIGNAAASIPSVALHPKVMSSSSMTDLADVKPTPGNKKTSMKPSMSADSAVDRRSGLFEKFEFTGQMVPGGQGLSTGSITTGIAITTLDSEDQGMPKMRLKLHQFRAPHGKTQSLDNSVTPSPTSAGSKSSNSNAFDFRSDEEEDDPMAYAAQPEHRLSVFASSATCLQISTKAKPSTPGSTPETSPPVKPEKYKRKDKSGSGNSGKRKRDREDSRKEKKRKKLEVVELYQNVKEPVYRSATIEGDDRSGTKLKIRVSKEHIKTPSPLKETSKQDRLVERADKLSEKINETAKRRSSSPLVEKLVLSKQDLREHMVLQDVGRTESTQVYHSAVAKSGKMSSGKTGGGGNSALSKSDPKLAKATIRLKPLNMSAAASASVTLASPAKSLLGGRSSGSERSERRGQSVLAAAGISTPPTAALSLSSILPNAPTASSVASLPPIPKLSSLSNSGKSASSVMTPASKSIPNSSSLANNLLSKGNVNVNISSGGRAPSNSNMTSSGSRSSPNTVSGTTSLNKLANANSASQKASGAMSHKLPGSASTVGMLKGSGTAGHSGSSQKIAGVPVQGGGPQKVSSAPNQYSYSKQVPGIPNQSGLQRIPNVSGHSSIQKQSASSGGMIKTAHGSLQKVACLPSQPVNYQKVSNASAGGGTQPKESSSPNQSGLSKTGGQHLGSQKTSVMQSSACNKTLGSSLQRTSSASVMQGAVQKNSMQSQGSAVQKVPGATTSITSPGQKSAGGQGRSLSTSIYNSSPSSSGRLPGGVKNSSAFSSTGRAPPNHLPINRSLSNPCPRTGSGSSPRASSGQSPSTPTASRFPSSSPQRNPGTSPSSNSQRNSHGSSAQRPSTTSQPTSGQRQGGSQAGNSQKPSSSPLCHQRTNSFSGSSPNHRPASTPCSASSGDQRVAAGAGQSPGYPVRPSSAGPRQSSSPLGSKQNQSPGSSKSGSSPSSQRTASPLGQKQNVAGQKQNMGGNSVAGSVSPLALRASASGITDSLVVSRQSSNGTLNSSSLGSKLIVSVNDDASMSTNSVPRQCGIPQGTTGTNSSSGTSAKLSAADSASAIMSLPAQTSMGDNPVSMLSTTVVPKSSMMSNCSVTTTSSGGALHKTSLSASSGRTVTSGAVGLLASKTDSTIVSSAGVTVSSKNQAVKTVINSSGNLGKSNTNSYGNLPPLNSLDSFNKSMALDTSSCVSSVLGSTDSDSLCHTSLCVVSSGTESLNNPTTTVSTSTSAMALALVSTTTSSVTAGPATSASVPSSVCLSSSSVYPAAPASASVPVLSASKMSAVPRGRKGSLSAIVNKLATKVSSSVVTVGSELHEATVGVTVLGEALGADKSVSGGGVSDPSKEMPHPAHVQVHSTALLLARRRSAADGESSFGQVDQDRGPVKRPASSSSLSPPSLEPKIARIDPFSKAIAMALSAPSAHLSMSPHKGTAVTPAAIGERTGRLSSGSDRSSPLSQHREVEELGLDLSLPKDRPHQDSVHTSQKELRMGVGRSSPRAGSPGLCSSPVQGADKPTSGATKFNGESTHDKSRVESEVFKVPTPKTQTLEDGDDRYNSAGAGRNCGNSGGGSESRSSGRQMPASPMSDASSPDVGLIIDCEESPNHNSSRPSSTANATSARISTPPVLPSPKRVSEIVSEQGLGSVGRASPGISGKVTPSPSLRTVKSSSSEPSPHAKPSPGSKSSPASVSPHPKEAGASSPCEIDEIDDELMDAALMGFGS